MTAKRKGGRAGRNGSGPACLPGARACWSAGRARERTAVVASTTLMSSDSEVDGGWRCEILRFGVESRLVPAIPHPTCGFTRPFRARPAIALEAPPGRSRPSQSEPVLAALEGGVEGDLRAREVEPAREGRGLARTVLAVHHRVLPLDRERALVAGVVELPDQRLEVDPPAAGRAEVPESPLDAEVGVAAEDADGRALLAPPHVLDVHVEDALAELADEADVVDALVAHVRRVEVQAEVRRVVDRRERATGAVEVEGDLGRVDLEREADADLLELLQDRRPLRREVAVAGLDHVLRHGREAVEQVPDRRAGEAVDDRAARELQALLHARRRGVEELARGLAGLDHLLRRALLHALGLAVAPDLGREDGLVALVDAVAHGLADEVRRDREAPEAVVLEHRPVLLRVVLVLVAARDVEVVAPARELQAVVAEVLGLPGEHLERQVGPLAGEETDRTGHDDLRDGTRAWNRILSPDPASGNGRRPELVRRVGWRALISRSQRHGATTAARADLRGLAHPGLARRPSILGTRAGMLRARAKHRIST